MGYCAEYVATLTNSPPEAFKYLWVEDEDHPQLASQPIGVPGATPPPKLNVKPSPNPSPSPLKDKGKKGGKQLDLGIELDDAGLEGVTVTDEELGLDGLINITGQHESTDVNPKEAFKPSLLLCSVNTRNISICSR